MSDLPTKPGPYYWRKSDGDEWKLGNVFRNYDKRFHFETFNIGGKPVVDLQGQWLPVPPAAELVELQAAKKMVDDGAEIVSCNNKPPMTVWLAFDAVDCFDRNEECGASDLKNHHHQIGPYVNLEQFMKEVERRASCIRFPHSRNNAEAGFYAMQELAKEIEDGKE